MGLEFGWHACSGSRPRSWSTLYSYRSLELHKHGAKRHLPISPFRSPWLLNKSLLTVCPMRKYTVKPCERGRRNQASDQQLYSRRVLRSAWLMILGAVARCPKTASWASGRPAFARMLVCQPGTSVLLFAESTMFPSVTREQLLAYGNAYERRVLPVPLFSPPPPCPSANMP